MNTDALNIRTVIDGVEYGDDAVRQWELDRSRAALTLLKQRIGDERMRELLAPISPRQTRRWHSFRTGPEEPGGRPSPK